MRRIIVFDFDGVLVDSNGIKQRAFFDLFPETVHPIITKVISDIPYHWSRFDILRSIVTALPPLKGGVDEYERKYRAIVRNAIIARGVIPGVYELLRELRTSGRTLYLNSATPAEALSELIDALDLRRCFSDVFGRPPTKLVNLMDIMARERAKTNELVMIGDGKEDRVSSKALDILFIGIANEFNGWANTTSFPIAGNVFSAIDRLKEIEQRDESNK